VHSVNGTLYEMNLELGILFSFRSYVKRKHYFNVKVATISENEMCFNRCKTQVPPE
jgi:hypothetical protein